MNKIIGKDGWFRGRVTNFSKEYLLFKSMVYAEENGLSTITARSLASFVAVLLYPIYAFLNQSVY